MNFVAKKSIFGELGAFVACFIFGILALIIAIVCFVLIPCGFLAYPFLIIAVILLVIFTVKCVIAKSYRLEFNDKKVKITKGIISKQERQSVVTNILAINVDQSFWGRIFNYGNVKIDMIGKWDVDTRNIKAPGELKKFLEGLMEKNSAEQLHQVITD